MHGTGRQLCPRQHALVAHPHQRAGRSYSSAQPGHRLRRRRAGLAAHAAPTAVGEPLLQLEGVSKSHDGLRILFSDLTFTLCRGDRMAVIGANGSGKTSMLRLLSGADWPDDGTVNLTKNTIVGFLQQQADIEDGQTALEAVVKADTPIAQAVRRYNALIEQGDKASKQDVNAAMDVMSALGGWELEALAKEALEQVGITNTNMPVAKMSGGQRRKVTVAAALLGAPDVLILDEPTNHMDVQFIEWMSRTILEQQMTILLVTHDRAFMETMCTRLLELDSGKGHLYEIGGEGSYKRYQQLRQARRDAQASAAQDARVMLRKESDWMARQPKARGTKAKARVDSFYELQEKAKSGPRRDVLVNLGEVSMARQGKKVLVMEECSKVWDGRKLIDSFSYDFAPGERLGLVGPNGSGKTTLLDMLSGRLALDEGHRELGETSVVGYFAQHPPEVNPRLKVIDYLVDVSDKAETTDVVGLDIDPAKMLAMLGFPYERHQQYVSSLSGGERRRLHLASVLVTKPNFLILDEPTNDLDLATIEVLEIMLEAYSGCVLIVSHDRAFMENVVDAMLILDGSGSVRRFAGRYSAYLKQVQAATAATHEAAAAAADEERRAASAERASSAAASNGASAALPAASQKPLRRLGFREKEEYSKLEGEIDTLTEKKEALEASIAETASTGDFAKVGELTATLQKMSDEVEFKTDRWLELAERVEAAGSV